MIAHFHRAFGLLLLLVYIFLLAHRSSLLPGLEFTSVHTAIYGKQGTGWLIVLGLPLTAIACFLIPTQLMWWLSPRTPPDYDYLLTEGFWYAVGYALLALSVGLLSLFRQQLIA